MVITIVDKQRENITNIIDCIQVTDLCADIVMFTNTVDARDYLKMHPIDLLFVEVEMPYLTGIQLFSQIHKIQPSMKVVFLSDSDEYAQEVVNKNIFGYLVKPITNAQVKSIIEEIEMDS